MAMTVAVGVAVGCRRGGRRWLGREGFGYRLLGHGGSIERGALGGDDLRAQRAGGGRVDEARVARVLDAMHDGGLAVVGIGQRGLALEASVGARVAAGGEDGRLRARREDARGRGQGSPAGLRRLAGGNGGPLYVVRRVPSGWTALRQWGWSSCTRAQGSARHSRGEGGQRTGVDMAADGRAAALLVRQTGSCPEACTETARGKGHSHMLPRACFGSSSGGTAVRPEEAQGRALGTGGGRREAVGVCHSVGRCGSVACQTKRRRSRGRPLVRRRANPLP